MGDALKAFPVVTAKLAGTPSSQSTHSFSYPGTTPTLLGTRTFAPYDLKDLVHYIDWSPFFAAWELVGRFPDILQDDVVGEAARDLYKDAQEMLARIVEERWFEARGAVGIWPANVSAPAAIMPSGAA